MMDFDFPPAYGNSACVGDSIMTSQNYKKVEHVMI